MTEEGPGHSVNKGESRTFPLRTEGRLSKDELLAYLRCDHIWTVLQGQDHREEERMHELCETNERECHFKSLYCKQKSLKQRNSFATKGHAGLVSFNFKQKVR